MQKPLINNRFLSRKWRDQETVDLNCKVKNIKPWICNETPESFTFRKTHMPEHSINNRQEEIKRRNKIMADKICNLYINPIKTSMVKPFEPIKISLQAKTRRQEIQRIVQENLDFSKRLIERKPCLDKKKWESDYSLSKYYMSKICEYPSINFDKRTQIDAEGSLTNPNNPNNISNMRSSSNGFRDITSQLSMGFTRFNKTNRDKFLSFNKIVDEFLSHQEDDYGVKTTLFSGKTVLEESDDCYCKCYIENKRFVISVAPVISSYHSSHFLIFNEYEEVLKLCREFNSFEEILKCLEFRDGILHLRCKSGILMRYRTNKVETRVYAKKNSSDELNTMPSGKKVNNQLEDLKISEKEERNEEYEEDDREDKISKNSKKGPNYNQHGITKDEEGHHVEMRSSPGDHGDDGHVEDREHNEVGDINHLRESNDSPRVNHANKIQEHTKHNEEKMNASNISKSSNPKELVQRDKSYVKEDSVVNRSHTHNHSQAQDQENLSQIDPIKEDRQSELEANNENTIRNNNAQDVSGKHSQEEINNENIEDNMEYIENFEKENSGGVNNDFNDMEMEENFADSNNYNESANMENYEGNNSQQEQVNEDKQEKEENNASNIENDNEASAKQQSYQEKFDELNNFDNFQDIEERDGDYIENKFEAGENQDM